MMSQFLAGGATVFLTVTAVYIRELVAVAFSRFTPESLPAIVKWGVVALINYWLLINLLRLLISVMKWVLWAVKTLCLILLFVLIATDKNASTDTTATRLFGLVLGCVSLALVCEQSSSVTRRLSSMEARLKAIEKKTE